MRQLWGLDRPIYERFAKYVVNMLTFQWGNTVPTTGRKPVVDAIMQYLPNTLVLMGLSTMLAIVIGIIFGVMAAYKRGGLYDTSSVMASLLTMSLPTFWMGMIFLLFFMRGGPVDNMFGFYFPVGRITTEFLPPPITFNLYGFIFSLPTLVEIQDRLWHLFGPTFILALFQFGGYLLLTRATVLESMTEDYVVTARAKGLKERTVLFKHILKNASLPIITSVAIGLGFMLSGAIITEAIFSYPGIGTLTIKSLDNMDYPVVHAIFYITALTVIIANFFADLLYGVIDPRIKYG
jgi:peptide/nickel transport system permease protein